MSVQPQIEGSLKSRSTVQQTHSLRLAGILDSLLDGIWNTRHPCQPLQIAKRRLRGERSPAPGPSRAQSILEYARGCSSRQQPVGYSYRLLQLDIGLTSSRAGLKIVGSAEDGAVLSWPKIRGAQTGASV
jgi:hypothetical protein